MTHFATKRPDRRLEGRRRRTETLAVELRGLASVLVRRLRAESAGQTLSAPQMVALGLLHRTGRSTVADLARLERVTPQSMGATVASLESEGLVARTVDPADARRYHAALTEKGKRLVVEGRAARQAWLTRALDERLNDGEQRRLAEAVALLYKVLDE